MVLPRYRRQAQTLLQQFNQRGNELTWNSDGVIFIDQTSIPESNIFQLFPYLFKMKHPKDMAGFDDFQQKIHDMGLDHLIVKRLKTFTSTSKKNSNQNTVKNWWFLD
jgi:hypothetical protein